MTQWPSFGVTKDAKLQSKMEDIFWRGRCSALDFLMQLAFQVNSTGWGEPLLRKPGHSCGPRLHLPCSGPSSVRCCSASAQRDALLYLRASCRARPSCSPGHMESWNTYHVTERQVSRSKNPECFEGSKRAFKQKINKNNVYNIHGGAWRWKLKFFNHGRGWPIPKDWAACLKWELRQKFDSLRIYIHGNWQSTW